MERVRRNDEDFSHHSSRASPAIQATYLPTPNTVSGPARTSNALAGFTTGEDFIAFDFSDDEAEEDLPLKLSPGKGKGRERVDVGVQDRQHGLKRSADQMEAEGDGYASKKQRSDAASRLTPWAEYVDWDSCRNLAEMCVHFLSLASSIC
jgi:non-canonical poly(A) RNA polymerase PAPD5/7